MLKELSTTMRLNELCTTMEEGDEDSIITLFTVEEDMRKVINALLLVGYLVDNFAMTQAKEYPYLAGEKDGIKLSRLNTIIQNRPGVSS